MSGPWVAAFVALWLVTILNTVVVLGVLRRIAHVLERTEARPLGEADFGAVVGSRIDPFHLVDGDGRELAWGELVSEPTILLFMSTDCPGCTALAEHLVGVGEQVHGVPLVAVMDDTAEARREALPPGLKVLYQRDRAATRALDNHATPQAYVLDPSGVVLGRSVPGTLDDLRNLASPQRNGGERAKALDAAHQ